MQNEVFFGSLMAEVFLLFFFFLQKILYFYLKH